MGMLLDTVMDTTLDTITAKDLLMLKPNPLPPPSPDMVTDTVMVMDMVIPLLTDTMDTISARDPLSPVTDIMDTITARDPLSLLPPPHPDTVTDTVMLTVMVIPMLTDTMDTMPMVMASKFILLT